MSIKSPGIPSKVLRTRSLCFTVAAIALSTAAVIAAETSSAAAKTGSSAAVAPAPPTPSASPTASPSPALPITGNLPGRVLVGGSGRVFILGQDGSVVWTQSSHLTHDAWMLSNGNILFADGESVTEITPEHKIIFQYKSKEQHGGGTYSCQRLANGNTLIGENSAGRVLEVDSTGKIVFELATSPVKPGAHQNMRMARKLENGNYLVCQSGANLVKEYAPDGKVVMEIKTPKLAFAAIRTPAGTTLVSTLDHIIEYDTAGKAVWQFANTDLPGVTITNMTGMHLMESGNLAVGCYAAYKGKEGNALFEITHDKKLVWRFSDPRAGTSLMAIQRLDAGGKPLYGKCLR